MKWQQIRSRLIQGHRVASGQNGDSRYPAGTIAMQQPHFASLGLDLSSYFTGTINLSIAPYRYVIHKPAYRFEQVKWSPYIPPESFSFFDCQIMVDRRCYPGLIYYPDPDTKPEHFQPPDLLEILAPLIPNLKYEEVLTLAVKPEQMEFILNC